MTLLAFFVSLIVFVFNVIVIVTYFSMSDRLNEISANTMNTKNYVKTLTQQNIDLFNQQTADQIARRKQYFFDHCFADDLKPHDWVNTGYNQYTIEFTCTKCGQKIQAPRYLDAEPQVAIQSYLNQYDNGNE